MTTSSRSAATVSAVGNHGTLVDRGAKVQIRSAITRKTRRVTGA
jgi:hypothetical protein